MSTFLELCQAVCTESGVVPSATMTTTVAQTAKLAKIVRWTREAWSSIQRQSPDWRWMQFEWDGETVIGQRAYTAAEMGIASRFGGWHVSLDRAQRDFSTWLTADGQANEGFMTYVEWEIYRRQFNSGGAATDTGKPAFVTVDNQRSLRLYPSPDAVYTVRGQYRKSPQILADDADEPEMPEEFHEVIVWRALLFLCTHDEAFQLQADWRENYDMMMAELRKQQMPWVRLGGPLA